MSGHIEAELRGVTAGQEPYLYDNIVTVAESYDPKRRMTKTIYGNGRPDKKYDHGDLFNYHLREVSNLDEMKPVLERVLTHPRCCVLRSVPIDKTACVKRIFRDDNPDSPPTMVEEPQSWYALDVDNYGTSTGDIAKDAKTVLLALPHAFRYARCLAIASANYRIKTGIRLRLFLWNEAQVTYHDLRRYFAGYGEVVDLSLFHPIQPIYVAAPLFVGRSDPVPNRMAEVNPQGICTDIPHIAVAEYHCGHEIRCTKRRAESYLPGIFRRVAKAEYQGPGKTSRHWVLIREAIFMGKLVAQGHFDREFAYWHLWGACNQWDDHRDTKKDERTINDGLSRGIRAMDPTF